MPAGVVDLAAKVASVQTQIRPTYEHKVYRMYCEVTTPAFPSRDCFNAARVKAVDLWVKDMEHRGYRWVDPRDAGPEYRFHVGHPFVPRHLWRDDPETGVQTVPELKDADEWSYLIDGYFTRPALVTEYDLDATDFNKPL